MTLKLKPAILSELLREHHKEWIPILTLDGDFMLATTAYSERATDAQEVCRWTATANYPFMLRGPKDTIEIHSDVEFAAALWSLDCCGDFTVIHEHKKACCQHPNQYVEREGMTGQCGTVRCPDCGYEREWNAY